MVVSGRYRKDVESILAKRHVNGGDYWSGSDGEVGVGSPFSTIQCVCILSDLGMSPSSPPLRGACRLILSHWREDGRFQVTSRGAIYPCHTSGAARVLCRAGYANDKRLRRTFEHLLDTIHEDGGWRCNAFKYGRGPETRFSNPGPTLDALDAFRLAGFDRETKLDGAVEFLLDHWATRKPLGPCHFGIGSRFMQVEYPLLRYNLFNYVYVLSFFDRARKDIRFREALQALNSKVVDGRVVVENPHRGLADLSFCKKGMPSDAATNHYKAILRNCGG